ncbi:MAG: hypothetical protein AAFV29_21555, partial [Myxococcota bacterium]
APHDFNDDLALNAKLDALQRQPYMGRLYADLLATWKQAGGKLFVHYTFIEISTKWSKFGALETQDQPRNTAPKFDALQTFIETTPQWW